MKAEGLKFKEEGVERVLKDVFLPWYNAYRFFMQNVDRYQTVRGSASIYGKLLLNKCIFYSNYRILLCKNLNGLRFTCLVLWDNY